MKKTIIACFVLAAICMSGCKQKNQPEEEVYVDLGLKSGTLWKSQNEKATNKFFTFDEAVNQFGDKLPTKEQWKELVADCKWEYRSHSYTVIGPNGDSIILREEGRRNIYDVVADYGGYYWSSTPVDSVRAVSLYFDYGTHVVDDMADRGTGHSVRLVK